MDETEDFTKLAGILGRTPKEDWRHPFEKDLAKLDSSLLEDESFLQELYAALCNTFWLRKDKTYQEEADNPFALVNEDGEHAYSCSWRYAGGVADDLGRYGEVQHGRNYLEYYCSGGEGKPSPRVVEVLGVLGWIPKER